MSFIANLLWFAFGGIWLGLTWCLYGILAFCTIVGIPYGIACFRVASFAFCPFGKDIVEDGGTGAITFILNVIWIVFAGFWLALAAALAGILFCCTIIGIPFGIGCFKLAKASFAPLGKKIVRK